MTSPWFSVLPSRDPARCRLYCFPYAGAGHTVYQHWQQHIAPDIELALIKLPGRGARYGEPMPTILDALIAALVASLSESPALPFAFFGHSMGALLAFESSRLLARQQQQLPMAMFVSGCNAPHQPRHKPLLSDLPAAEFAASIQAMNGIPAEISQDPELLDFFLPIIHADFKLCEAYRYQPQTALDLPIIVMGGAQDPRVPITQLATWQLETTLPLAQWVYSGDHFYLFRHEAALVDRISQRIHQQLMSSPHSQLKPVNVSLYPTWSEPWKPC